MNIEKISKAIKENKKYYNFTIWYSTTEFEEITLLEDELEQKHKNQLLGEGIAHFNNMPNDLKLALKNYIDKQIKQIQC